MQSILVGGKRVSALVDWVPEAADCGWSFPGAVLGEHPAVAARWLGGGQFATRFTAFLIGRDVLVDCGVGPDGGAYFPGAHGRLGEALLEAGSSLEAVRDVVFTHLHMDHVGWAPYFPQARFHVAAAEWAHWRQGAAAGLAHHTAAVADCIFPLAAAGRLRVVAAGEDLLPGLAYRPAPGHTPGHQAVLVGERLLIAGDAWHNPAQIAVPGWCHRADRDPIQAIATRTGLAEAAMRQGWLVGAGHFMTPFGRIGPLRSGGAGFEPVSG